jgi:DNA-binding IclR family transcriptional regulator
LVSNRTETLPHGYHANLHGIDKLLLCAIIYARRTLVLYIEVVMSDNKAQTRKKYKVPAVEQAIRVILYLANSGNSPQSLTNICREVRIHNSKAFSILNTLQEYDFVKKYPNRGGYVLGPGLLIQTGKMLENLSLPRLAEPILTELAKKARATVALGLISDDKAYVIAQYEGAPEINISSRLGSTTSITYGAHGKAIAAFLPKRELEDLLQKKELFFYGSPDKFDRTRLESDMVQCRRDGFTIDLGDIFPGVNAIGVPLLDKMIRPIGYITVVGFFTEEDARNLGPLAAEAAKEISRKAGDMAYWKKS